MMNFIKSRFNKDNFWNLIFFSLTFLGFGISAIINFTFSTETDFAYSSSFFFWLTMIGVPLFLKYKSGLIIDSKKQSLLTNSGKEIKYAGGDFIVSVILAIVVTILMGAVFDNFFSSLNIVIAGTIMIFAFLFTITSFFILKNIPIASAFYKVSWKGDPNYKHTNTRYKTRESLFSTRNLIINPINSWFSGNIHHRRDR